MDGCESAASMGVPARQFVITCEVERLDARALSQITNAFGDAPMALIQFFVSPQADFAEVAGTLSDLFPDCRTIGCTTAGEIGGEGYSEGGIVLVGFPASHFAAEPELVLRLGSLDRQGLISRMIRRRARLISDWPDWRSEFAMLLVDGLSLMEDQVAAACADALGPVPFFGGSAGDGTRFLQTAVALDGKVHSDAAILTYFRTPCRVQVFTTNHLTPTNERMVVTSADPSRRVVREINAEPAAREYARILGKDPEQLNAFTFAAHPVTVRFGGRHQVRAIRQVSETGELVFFSAIEEGLVLSLATPEMIAQHLDTTLGDLSVNGRPDTILACDCILRRLEAQEKQQTRDVSDVLKRHGVVGFSTYGEQFGGMHVNQTMTGVAIYAPEDERAC